jgi:hypothetical protein
MERLKTADCGLRTAEDDRFGPDLSSEKLKSCDKFSQKAVDLFLELRANVLYEICDGATTAVSPKLRDSTRLNFLKFLLDHPNEVIGKERYNALVCAAFRMNKPYRMDKMLLAVLPRRIFPMYFSAKSGWAICHSPVQIVRRDVELATIPWFKV